MSNNLIHETSPYLLQHAENPVIWYSWCEEAFKKAKLEDKPIFLSIGYSTCHWCHVMAHESFEDQETANLLNKYFVSIKVDKEERPDIDSIYMSFCQAFTGSGGWPMSIFMTPEQKPFYAGTYFPQKGHYSLPGFPDLLNAIHDKWVNDRKKLLKSTEKVIDALKTEPEATGSYDQNMIDTAIDIYTKTFDNKYGGFGNAPKFPTPHNLIFLLKYYKNSKDETALQMAETTLLQMYKGGMFDHIGYGFSRYSTDRFFLVPHFEKMLYDNALLIIAYCEAYDSTKKSVYKEIAIKTARYILREMVSPDGGFYSAQDADSEGEEGKYYVFTPAEIIDVLGSDIGKQFNEYYSITESGNFEGKSIPNLLFNNNADDRFSGYLPKLTLYRRNRAKLHLDDKILTSWNSLMIVAFCRLYRITHEQIFLETAVNACNFIQNSLCKGDTLYVSYRDGKTGKKGFLDDYASFIFALTELFQATLDKKYIESAKHFCKITIKDFKEEENGGFYLYSNSHEQLFLRPKETYDGAIPSGNSIMTYNLVRLFYITSDEFYEKQAKEQIHFMSANASEYPPGYSMFLIALETFNFPPEKIVAVSASDGDLKDLPFKVSPDSVIIPIKEHSEQYHIINGKTTYYICRNQSCLPPTNDI